MPPPRGLRALARWFQEGVVLPHEAGRRRRRAAADAVLLPSRTLTADERLGIYSEAYFARLVEALEEDFPAVRRRVGPRAFHRLSRAYLERFPSRSRLLNPLGRHLPEFLSGRVRIPRRGAARDLARVEVAMAEVFDEAPAVPLRPGDFASAPARVDGAVRLRFIPAFRLLELDYPVNAYIDAVRQGRPRLPPLRRRRSWMAVYRKEFQVWRLDLEEPAYRGLSAIQSGSSLAQAVRAIARRWRGRPERLEPSLRRWFGEWVSEGFFRKRGGSDRSARGRRVSR